MAPLPKRRIAASYLPSRYHYWYSLSKLAMDPLYETVRAAFANDRSPLLDVGCGIGLLLHCLRTDGTQRPYLGVDNDSAKIDVARNAATRSGLRAAHFQVCDLNSSFPQHSGSVALLDVLQYLEPASQEELLAKAARCVMGEGRLVIRGGLDDGGWRAAVTRTADRFAHSVRWMGPSFKAQPKPSELAALLADHGLQAQFRPLWGRTPFNNWLVIATKHARLCSSGQAANNVSWPVTGGVP